MQLPIKYDFTIVGAGMVGAATALALANLGLKVAIIETQQLIPFEPSDAIDLRVSAISLGSEQLLKSLNCWRAIEGMRSVIYRRLGVWESELFYTEFNANEIKQDHLGHIIENRIIQLALWQQVLAHENITPYCPDEVKQLTEHNNFITVQLKEEEITTKLVVAADGANSSLRTKAHFGTTGWQYDQSAMLINVKTTYPSLDITWQQFTSTGPMAYLPLPDNNASLVWYNSLNRNNELMQLSLEALSKKVKHYFPRQLGEFELISRASFPLTRRQANHYVKGRILLIGDAAHSINPMAGQGVNLGFKDVLVLQEVMAAAISNHQTIDDPSVLLSYQQKRKADNLFMMSAMDVLYHGFSHPSPAIKALRNLGLFVTKTTPWLKKRALRYASGLN